LKADLNVNSDEPIRSKMSNQRILTCEDLALLSNKELKKKLKNTLSMLEVKRQRGEDTSDIEQVYWLLQMERLKRLKGRNY
jgi:hypothetical protein